MKNIVVLCMLVLMSSFCLAEPGAATINFDATATAHAKHVKVTILSTMLADAGIGEWGFAALVEVDGNRVLFDTGVRPDTVLLKRRYDEQNWSKEAWVASDHGHVEDTIKEDMSLIIDTDEGMIVVTGCGHAGIANILARSQELLPGIKVKAVIGGLHLFAADEKKLQWTAEKMRAAGVQYLLAAHCTGLEATYRLRALLNLKRETAVVAAVGSSYSNLSGIDPLALAR